MKSIEQVIDTLFSLVRKFSACKKEGIYGRFTETRLPVRE